MERSSQRGPKGITQSLFPGCFLAQSLSNQKWRRQVWRAQFCSMYRGSWTGPKIIWGLGPNCPRTQMRIQAPEGLIIKTTERTHVDAHGCHTCKSSCDKDATNRNTCTGTPATDPCSMLYKKHRRQLWKLRRNTHWQPQRSSIHPLLLNL